MSIETPRDIGESFQHFAKRVVLKDKALWEGKRLPKFFDKLFEDVQGNPRALGEWMAELRAVVGEQVWAEIHEAWMTPPTWFPEMKGKWASYNPKYIVDAPREIQN